MDRREFICVVWALFCQQPGTIPLGSNVGRNRRRLTTVQKKTRAKTRAQAAAGRYQNTSPGAKAGTPILHSANCRVSRMISPYARQSNP